MTSSQYRGDIQRKSKTWGTTRRARKAKRENRKTDEFSYLSPDKLSQPEENAPHPLVQVQRLTAEWLSSKLHNHNLHNAKHKPLKYITNQKLIMSQIK